MSLVQEWELTVFPSAYRWIEYHDMSVEKEKDYIRKAITSLKSLSGYAPRGWYYGRNSPHSRTLVPQVYEVGDEKELVGFEKF